MLLSIIVPVFNEEKFIISALESLKFSLASFKNEIEVIVINDGSYDKTLSLLEKNNNLYHKLINIKKNSGKGAAVKIGLENSSGNYVIFYDADLEYEASDIIDFINLIKKKEPDLIIGSRKIYKNYTRSHYIYNYFGNRIITLLFNLFFNTTFTDIYSCYICFKKNLIEIKKLKTLNFEQHAEILIQVVRNGKKFYEIPINYNGRTYLEGKKIKFYHIFKIFYVILFYRFY